MSWGRFHQLRSQASAINGTRGPRRPPLVWLFVLAFGVLMIVGGVHGHRSARAERAVVEQEGRMDRWWEYRLAKRQRDGPFFICLGLFTAAVGTFGVTATMFARRIGTSPAAR